MTRARGVRHRAVGAMATVLTACAHAAPPPTPAAPAPTAAAPPAPAAWAAVAQALGRAGTPMPGGVYRVSFPRGDLSLVVAGVRAQPQLALGGWVAFMQTGGDAIAMGDLVLTEDEVPAVMSTLQAGGVEQSALHNHLLGEMPRVLYLHVHARGNAVHIAQTIRQALERTHTPLGPAVSGPAPASALDTAQLRTILRVPGTMNGPVWQVSVPRPEVIRDGVVTLPPAMGVATSFVLQPTIEGRAAATGDFVLLAAEVNPVIRALREGRVTVTAVHSHLLDESPRLFFLHFWAEDDALSLARTLRAALDRTRMAR